MTVNQILVWQREMLKRLKDNPGYIFNDLEIRTIEALTQSIKS